MLRSLFQLLVGLHPRAFRERFAVEMLSVFDHSNGKKAALSLVADALLSFLRQWGFRPSFWNDAVAVEQPQPASAGAPAFFVLESRRPTGMALIHGGILSLLFFVVISLAVLNARGSQVQPWLPSIKPESLRGTPAVESSDGVAKTMRTINSYQPPGAQSAQPEKRPVESPSAAAPLHPPRIATSAPAGPTSFATVARAPLATGDPPPQISRQMSRNDALRSSSPSEVAASAAPLSLQAYAGTYVVKHPLSLRVDVTAEGGQLFLTSSGKPKTALVRCSGLTFRYEDSPNCGVIFSIFDRGKFQQLNLDQGDGHRLVVRRGN